MSLLKKKSASKISPAKIIELKTKQCLRFYVQLWNTFAADFVRDKSEMTEEMTTAGAPERQRRETAQGQDRDRGRGRRSDYVRIRFLETCA